MLRDIEEAIGLLEPIVATLDPETLAADDAVLLVKVFGKGERLCAAAKSLAARRVAQCGTWRDEGERSAADWLAKETGDTVGAAAKSLETAQRMAELGDIDEAFRNGELSRTQANDIASATINAPNKQKELLELAKLRNAKQLADRCREIEARALNEEARRQRLHRRRFLKTWTDDDGMFRLSGGLAPEVGAQFLACLAPFESAAFEEGRKEGRREPYAAYGADALVAMAEAAATGNGMADGRTAGRRTNVHVLIDRDALARGRARDDECVEILGVGPVAVSTVKEMMDDAFLSAVVTDGVDVFNVAHIGRKPTAHQRTALVVRDGLTCVVADCAATTNLEIDHVEEWSKTRRTTLRRLAHLCHFHHRLKTVGGFRLVGEPGRWRFLRPDGAPADGLPAA
ncbi:MAG: DUF222 domain-containing protein [Actinobacteria bacterium]|nr:DUF222 domain-containing protein [Actinomycetota bacterium]